MSSHEQTEPTRPRCARLLATTAAIVLATGLGCGSVHDKPSGADAGADPTADAAVETGDAGYELDAAVPPRCGDGHVDEDETCDDGNSVTDDCDYGQQSCTVCTATCEYGQGKVHVCGDDVTDPDEQCDDGNAVTEHCTYGEQSCTVCTESCTMGPGISASCGDGNVDPEEQCDDGNTVTEACAYGQQSCTVCASNCQTGPGITSYCGDGTTNGSEQCDDGNTVTETCAYGQQSCTVCNSSCKLAAGQTAFCGDNIKNGSEQCDDGNTVTEACAYGQTSCTVCGSGCTYQAGQTAFCGDNTVNGGEQCDDGNTTTETCAYGQTSCTVCNASCHYQAGQTAYCGDGTINGAETCEGGTNATCAGQGFAGGVVSCTACKVDTSGCYNNTPQITSLSWWKTGNNPDYNWPEGTWFVRMIFVDPDGNLLGNLSDKWQTSVSGNVYYLLRLNTQHGVPSTDYKLRVYRTMQGDFSLNNLSWVGYADYSCNAGGSIASYCKAGSDIDGPWLRHGDFSLPY